VGYAGFVGSKTWREAGPPNHRLSIKKSLSVTSQSRAGVPESVPQMCPPGVGFQSSGFQIRILKLEISEIGGGEGLRNFMGLGIRSCRVENFRGFKGSRGFRGFRCFGRFRGLRELRVFRVFRVFMGLRGKGLPLQHGFPSGREPPISELCEQRYANYTAVGQINYGEISYVQRHDD